MGAGGAMVERSDDWGRLDSTTNDAAWSRIRTEFGFRPSMDPNVATFVLPVPHDVYDISGSPLSRGDQELARLVDTIFTKCIGDDDHMLFLESERRGSRFDPQLLRPEPKPIQLLDGAGHPSHVLPPEYFPWGDYHLWVATDLSWGYLTHPWLLRAWVYGEPLAALIRQHAPELGFVVLR
jgi:hypothetical protein